MKKFAAFLLVLLHLSSAKLLADEGRTEQLLQSYLSTDISISVSTSSFNTFLIQLSEKQKKFKNERDFVSHVFHKTHQKFLKDFEAYASFGELLHSGRYNCLTGTALYALILEHFNIKHTIIETNYHIFILAIADGETILLEATDPINGFVEREREIAEKLAAYRENSLQENVRQNRIPYQFSFSLWESTSLDELTGLLYFNKAVRAFNAHELENSALFLIQAGTYRPSQRIQEFASIVMVTIATSELSDTRKDGLIRQLKIVRRYSEQLLTASVGQ